jgi:ribonuclease HII
MAWILGIDEAGYGPNLGPFVMSAVACQVADAHAGSCLWQRLSPAVRRSGDGNKKDGRLLVDDSKVVYSSAKGLAGLERGVFSLLGSQPLTLDELLLRLCPADRAEVATEIWYTGRTPLPTDVAIAELEPGNERFHKTCETASVTRWLVWSTVVCPARFNALVERAGTKSAVLAHAFIRLLRSGLEDTTGSESLLVFIDKQGGRNSYAAQIQHALDKGMVVTSEESMSRSSYRIVGLPREARLTFQPRADQEYFCVALASMVSKYLRELFMGEFNRFWQQHVQGLKATAGYPGDASRFLEAIRPAAETLKIPQDAIWRQK